MSTLALKRDRFVQAATAFGLVLITLALVGLGLLAASGVVHAADETATALPVPRFVSLKADKVNVRSGPTRNHPLSWIFNRAGLPVEIVAEYETWRRVRDSDGTEGWVYHSMLSGRRTVVVAPWDKKDLFPLYERATKDAAVVAKLQPGVVGSVKACDGRYCRVVGEGFDGWMEQAKLFGVYPNEVIN